jgi:hypothetical protein
MLARTTGQKEIVEMLEKAGADRTLKPSGPAFEKLVEKFRPKAQPSAGSSPATPGSIDATPAGIPTKVHLDPKVREVMLQFMNRCKPKGSEG